VKGSILGSIEAIATRCGSEMATKVPSDVHKMLYNLCLHVYWPGCRGVYYIHPVLTFM
jgi:hypothetical protein